MLQRLRQQQAHPRVALGHGGDVGRALRDARQVSQYVRVAAQVPRLEVAHGGEREHIHDVGRGELAASKVRHLGQPRLHHRQGPIHPLPRRLCRRVALGRLDAAQHHVAAQVRLQVAVGKVEPVQVVGKVSVLRRQRQPAPAMPGNDVLHDGARLGNLHIAIGHHRRRASRVQGAQLGRGQAGDRVAGVVLERVGNAQLFAKPDDPLGLGDA